MRFKTILLSKGNTTDSVCVKRNAKLNNKPQIIHSVCPIINWVDNPQMTYKYLKMFSIGLERWLSG
jgi:KaiC/GvpD/RAD55 family RecA-like ATPase